MTRSADPDREDPIRELAEAITARDPKALARGLTIAQYESETADRLVGHLDHAKPGAPIVGFTGAPGVGKSSLVSAYAAELRRLGKTVAIVAVDPSSPLSGGSVLGDRVRMLEHVGDNGVFIRSVASCGHAGGLTRSMRSVIRILDAFGWDTIILETVGTGQSETQVGELADTIVLVTSPEAGDAIQVMKAGVLEIVDVISINKSDLGGAHLLARRLADLNRFSARARNVTIVETSAANRTGIAELGSAIATSLATGPARSDSWQASARLRREVESCVASLLTSKLHPDLQQLSSRIADGEISLEEAATRLLRALSREIASGSARAGTDRD